jgi:hypothetical protein
VSGSPEQPVQLALDPSLVCVVDSSCLINFKRLVPTGEQWALLMHMTTLVQGGSLAFPRQVAKEMEFCQYPDAPGVWIANAKHLVVHHQPSEQSLITVLAVAQLVEPDNSSENEVADPYVAAMAYELNAQPEYLAVVATDDQVDRMPAKESLATACARLKIERWAGEQFIEWARASLVRA